MQPARLWRWLWKWLDDLSVPRALLWGLLLAVLVEGLTCFLRFGLGLKAAESTSWEAHFTFGYRLHHGFIGIVMLLVAPLIRRRSIRNLLIVAGTALFVSDAFHHTLLWLVYGSPELDLRYPEVG